MPVKISKEDEYIEKISTLVAWINKDTKWIGVFNTIEDMLKINKNHAFKKLRNTFKYRVQMVDKELWGGGKIAA